jgi:hypothetical protein
MSEHDQREALRTRITELEGELDQLREQLTNMPPEDRWEPETPVPTRDAAASLVEYRTRTAVLEDALGALEGLDNETLALVVKFLDELGGAAPEVHAELIVQVRSLVDHVTVRGWTR